MTPLKNFEPGQVQALSKSKKDFLDFHPRHKKQGPILAWRKVTKLGRKEKTCSSNFLTSSYPPKRLISLSPSKAL